MDISNSFIRKLETEAAVQRLKIRFNLWDKYGRTSKKPRNEYKKTFTISPIKFEQVTQILPSINDLLPFPKDESHPEETKRKTKKRVRNDYKISITEEDKLKWKTALSDITEHKLSWAKTNKKLIEICNAFINEKQTIYPTNQQSKEILSVYFKYLDDKDGFPDKNETFEDKYKRYLLNKKYKASTLYTIFCDIRTLVKKRYSPYTDLKPIDKLCRLD